MSLFTQGEKRIYALTVLWCALLLFMAWPLVEMVFGVGLLFTFMLYTLLAPLVGLPPLAHCSHYCGQ